MKTSYIRALAVVALIAACLVPSLVIAGTAWNDIKAGNPVLPGYFADPCCRKFGDTYYLYVTPDGWDVGRGPFCIWTSKDFVHWASHKSPSVQAGKFWPATDFKWAPSVVKHDGRYYMYNQTPCMIWGAVGETPLGPWQSLSEEGKPMIPDATPKGTIVLDGECFIDDDDQIYMWYSTWWTPTVAKLESDMATIKGDPIQYFKKDNNQTPYGTVQGCMEAPYMFKHDGTYYLMYSNNMCQDSSYCVEYSTSKSPIGPFTYGKNNPILATNDDDTVDGPGHHTILEDGGKIYIIYHRHDNPHAADGAHRQTAIDELHFNADGSIEKVVPSHSGVGYLAASTVRDTNVALGVKATASSFAGPDFGAGYATDENNGTLWKASEYKFPQWLQIDLGKSQKVARVETEFQFAQVPYQYVIESSNDAKTWRMYADRSKNTDWGPMIDKAAAKARYFRLTITGDNNTQRPSPEIAIWNIKVYDGVNKANQAPKVDAGADVAGSVSFPTRVVDGTVSDDGLPSGPVSVKWSKVSGPGDVKFEHADRAYSKVTFGGAGTYVLKLAASDGKLTGSDTVTYKILPTSDELVWYKFDEPGGAVAQDSSINGQNGVMRIGTRRGPGMYGGSLNMGGGDSVNVPPLGDQGDLTIAAWVNPHTLNADQNSIVCSAGENTGLQATVTRKGEIRVVVNGAEVSVSGVVFAPGDLGWWKHIAVVYRAAAGDAVIYVDGKRIGYAFGDVKANRLDLSAGLKIGGGVNGVRGLDGELDDFRIYAKALSDADVAKLAVPTKFAGIAQAKKMADGTAVKLMAKVVTFAPKDPMSFARSTDFFHVSERDGSDGIMVRDGNAGQDAAMEDSCVSFSGVMKTAQTGERYVELTSAPAAGAPCVARVSKSGEVASLVTVKGVVRDLSRDALSFTVSSGAQTRVAVSKGTLVMPFGEGNTVEVTGVVSSVGDGKSVLLLKDLNRLDPPASPLLAEYKFDETSGGVAKDSSGDGLDATLVNDPTWVAGMAGNAVCFDGKKSYVQLPDLGLQRALTISLWVNETSLGNDGWSTALVHADSWNLGDLHLQIPCKQGNIGAAVNGAGDVNSKFVFVDNLNKWVHVAFTYDAKARNMALYVNGKLEGNSGFGEGRPINLTHSKLGSWGGGSRFFDGKIDDLRIYNRVLSADEIARLYEEK